ncbi:MAG: stage III sporulation protein AE [Firmicutes bacterium]|nr:stage III sporulation protein AE [Bacillota bacterium]
MTDKKNCEVSDIRYQVSETGAGDRTKGTGNDGGDNDLSSVICHLSSRKHIIYHLSPGNAPRLGAVRRVAALAVLLLILPLVLFQGARYASAADQTGDVNEVKKQLSDNVEKQLKDIDVTELETMLAELGENQKTLFGGVSFSDKLRIVLSGDFGTDYNGVFSALASIFFAGVLSAVPAFAAIVGIAVLCSVLNTLKSGRNNAAYFACFGLVVIITGYMIVNLSVRAGTAVNSMRTQMDAGFPVLLAVMAATGSTASAAVYQPVVLILSNIVARMMTAVILPLFIFSFALNIVGGISPSVKLDKLSAFMTSLSKWVVGLVFTVFMAMLTIQGVTAGVHDGVSVKAARYAISRSVPVIGGYLSDGLNLIIAGSTLIKNAFGYVSVFLLLAQIAGPVLVIAAASLLLKLTAAVVEPMSENDFSGFLSGAAKSLSMLNVVIISTAFMYFITIMLIICTGNQVLYT